MCMHFAHLCIWMFPLWCQTIISNWSCPTRTFDFLKPTSPTASPLVFRISIKGTNIHPLVQAKSLGIVLHSSLSFVSHIQSDNSADMSQNRSLSPQPQAPSSLLCECNSTGSPPSTTLDPITIFPWSQSKCWQLSLSLRHFLALNTLPSASYNTRNKTQMA